MSQRELDEKIKVRPHDRRVEIPIEDEAANGGCTCFVGGIREFVLNKVLKEENVSRPRPTLIAIRVSRARYRTPYGIFLVDCIMAAMKASDHHLSTWRSRSNRCQRSNCNRAAFTCVGCTLDV